MKKNTKPFESCRVSCKEKLFLTCSPFISFTTHRTFLTKFWDLIFWFWFPDCGRPVHVGRSVSRFGDAFRHVKVLCRTDPTFPRISRHAQHRDGRKVWKRPQVIIFFVSRRIFSLSIACIHCTQINIRSGRWGSVKSKIFVRRTCFTFLKFQLPL